MSITHLAQIHTGYTQTHALNKSLNENMLDGEWQHFIMHTSLKTLPCHLSYIHHREF